MKKLTLMGVLGILLPLLSLKAQLMPLKIGDAMPDLVLHNVINYKDSVIRLSDFRDKLVILDFWATYCAPCISVLPDYQKIQNNKNDILQLILVSDQSSEETQRFLHKKNINLISSCGNISLNKYFPHNSIPHEVWLKNGRVLAITHANQLTEENIGKVSTNQPIRLPEKSDLLDYDIRYPLLIDGNGGTRDVLIAHSVLTHYLEGLPGGGGVMQDSLSRKIRIINAQVQRLYQFAAERINPELHLSNRVSNASILQCKGSNALLNPMENPFQREYYYSYELILPTKEDVNMGNYMLEDLNRYFRLLLQMECKIQRQAKICWVLTHMSKKIPVQQPPNNMNVDSSQFQHVLLSNLFTVLCVQNQYQPIPFVNRTNIDKDRIIELPNDLTKIDEVNMYLKRYGYVLVKQRCAIDMLVFKNYPRNKR